jgi:hypothetical protein
MRNFFLQAIKACCKRNSIQSLFFNSNLRFEKEKKRVHMVCIVYYNILTIGINMF